MWLSVVIQANIDPYKNSFSGTTINVQQAAINHPIIQQVVVGAFIR